jgi:hypothetical protein
MSNLIPSIIAVTMWLLFVVGWAVTGAEKAKVTEHRPPAADTVLVDSTDTTTGDSL